jgi:hypothetical protein
MRSHTLLAAITLAALSTSALAVEPIAFHANTLTGLIPDLYAGLDVVSRELVGFIPSVSRNSGAERAAVGQAVKYHKTRAANGVNITPAMAIPEPTDQTVDYGTMTISKSRAYEFGFVGEEEKGLNANGPGALSVQADMFAQALRGIVNEIESDLAVEAAANASRAYGIAGTAPFGATPGVGDAAQVRKILDDNGAPGTGRQLVGNTSMGANLRSLTQLTKANEAGTSMTLTDGTLINLSGINIKESAQAVHHTKGTGASATTTNAGFAVGATTIALASAGTGTIVAGDVITFAGDTNKYVVVTGDADVSNGGNIVIAEPGLRVAIPASTTAITVGNSYDANVAFTPNAMQLAIRPPALPSGGDAAIDSMMLVDPRSGLVFEVRVYAGYRKVRYEVAAAWGVEATKREHIALLLG